MKKKITCLLMSTVMTLSLLAGCGGSAPAAGNANANAGAGTSSGAGDQAAKSDDTIKIGVSIWSSTDVLGSQCKLILDEAADALGVQVQYVDQGHVSEKVTASVEQLCAAGCDGIIICNSSDTEMASAIKTCNDNGVYLAQFFRIINSETSADIYKAAVDSQYYVGAVHENEPENGEKLVQILLDKGDRNIGLAPLRSASGNIPTRWMRSATARACSTISETLCTMPPWLSCRRSAFSIAWCTARPRSSKGRWEKTAAPGLYRGVSCASALQTVLKLCSAARGHVPSRSTALPQLRLCLMCPSEAGHYRSPGLVLVALFQSG